MTETQPIDSIGYRRPDGSGAGGVADMLLIKATALHIVRCVNYHEVLVDALKGMCEATSKHYHTQKERQHAIDEAFDAAQTVIRNATHP